jgi:hypothetical protein
MTAQKFRELALAIPGAVESEHMGHPDFRMGGKIFASLGYPDETRGMVKLTPEQQKNALNDAPDVFEPCAGAWGRGGSTSVHLAAAKVSVLRAALKMAAANVTAPRALDRQTSLRAPNRHTQR